MAKVSLRIDAIEPARTDQTISYQHRLDGYIRCWLYAYSGFVSPETIISLTASI